MQGLRSTLLLAAIASAVTAAPAAAAQRPDILSARFSTPPVAGVPAVLEIRVRDPLAAVNGVQVDLGDGTALKDSACRPPTMTAGLPPVAFRKNHTSRFTLTHAYAAPGRMTVRITAMSGACVGGVAVSMQDVKVRVAGLETGRASAPKARLAQTAACPSEERSALLCLINAVRAASGRGALRPHRKLRRAAIRHARDMVERDYFAHESPRGHDVVDRLRRARFRIRGSVGENLAAGTGAYGTPLGTVLAWMDSPPHRANLLERDFSLAGIGIADGAPGLGRDGRTYVLTLASP